MALAVSVFARPRRTDEQEFRAWPQGVFRKWPRRICWRTMHPNAGDCGLGSWPSSAPLAWPL